jgi:hypothetical protein
VGGPFGARPIISQTLSLQKTELMVYVSIQPAKEAFIAAPYKRPGRDGLPEKFRTKSKKGNFLF